MTAEHLKPRQTPTTELASLKTEVDGVRKEAEKAKLRRSRKCMEFDVDKAFLLALAGLDS